MHYRRASKLLPLACVVALLCGCSPALPAPTLVPAGANINGFVFRDLNADGVRDAREQGEPGITVSAYDAENRQVATAVTDYEGKYVLNAALDRATIAPRQDYRVEFSGWPGQLAPGARGKDSGGETQFVSGGTSNVSFGLSNSDQYVKLKPTTEGASGRPKAEPGATPLEVTSAVSPTATPEATGPYAGKGPVPDFPRGLDWLNTSRPLTLADLRGKVVILEFWTYGCIRSIETMPHLERLAQKYARELVIIGVHSAKFPHEAQTENIHRIVERYGITFPVINDAGHSVASLYGANIWPTVVMFNPIGQYLGKRSGDIAPAQLDRLIGDIVKSFDQQGLLNRTPLQTIAQRPAEPDSPLRFPSDVVADEAGGRLFIADTNHNRIVISDLSGKVLDVIGNGQAGLRNGGYATASFRDPQGITLADAHTLYVADTGNHALRRVNLATRTVETVAGTGEQVTLTARNAPARTTGLNYPWDALYVDGKVYLAMAGQHQVWSYDPQTEQLTVFAGTQREELTDAPLLQAGFDQPSVLATDGQALYVVDAEASAVRQADLSPAGLVRTIVGRGFYEWGDIDGAGKDVRLQHPLGLAYRDGLLYVADTYNNKIKTINPQTKETRTFLGTSTAGWRDGPEPLFAEPSGLSATGDKLYIADTNNHVIRIVDVQTKVVSTLMLADQQGLLARHLAL